MSQMIVPDDFDEREVDRVVYQSLQELVEIAEANYALSYANWSSSTQPQFYTTGIIIKGNNAEVEYSTEDVPYVWVDDGTKAHDQVAKNATFMKFPERTIPKTRPGQLASFSSFTSKKMVSAKKVRNPGIKKRGFTDEVVEILDEVGEGVFDKHFAGAKTI